MSEKTVKSAGWASGLAKAPLNLTTDRPANSQMPTLRIKPLDQHVTEERSMGQQESPHSSRVTEARRLARKRKKLRARLGKSSRKVQAWTARPTPELELEI